MSDEAMIPVSAVIELIDSASEPEGDMPEDVLFLLSMLVEIGDRAALGDLFRNITKQTKDELRTAVQSYQSELIV